MIAEGDWDAATGLLRGAERVVVSCHVHPDGDALGSAMALHRGLARLGRPAIVSFSEPFAVGPQYAFLDGLDALTPPGQVPSDADLFVCFDTAALDRLGTLTDAFAGAAHTLVVDHHASNTRFGELNLVDPEAPASAVLCRELLRRLGATLDPAIATLLYTGLVTDTGRFQYPSTTGATHRLAAELLDAGVRQYELAKVLFEANDFGYLKLLGDCLQRSRQEPSAALIWTSVSTADLARHAVTLDQTEGLIDVLRTDRSSEVTAVLKQQPEGSWKVSLRSRGRVDVGAVAQSAGGGGHRLAAGYTSEIDPEDTVASLVRRLCG